MSATRPDAIDESPAAPDPTLAGIRARCQAGSSPAAELTQAQARIEAWADPALWIHRAPPAEGGGAGPLAGVAVAVKDNIDVAGMPTTAGCPSFARVPALDAPVVAALRGAGAMVVGKTNLDQFATGLVGTRSPYGTPRNPFDPALIPGGSSSGSACAVAAGLVPLALGTDTAGSGRVPAACTNIVGLKPTRGWLSTRGVVPAVRTIDCVSLFTLTVADAWQALQVVTAFDPVDPFARVRPPVVLPTGPLRIGIPRDLGGPIDAVQLQGYRTAQEALRALGHRLVPIDLAPFLAAGELLYGSGWVAERTAAVGDFLAGKAADADPVVRAIIDGGRSLGAVDAWRGIYELARLSRLTAPAWADADVLLLPTIPHHPTRAEVADAPVEVNRALGRFTTFGNLLDCCALALPAALAPGPQPVGVMLVGPAWHDPLLCQLGHALQHLLDLPLGATGRRSRLPPLLPAGADGVVVAVFGAHLRGQPLHPQLLSLQARWVGECLTAPRYRCHLLPGTPARPGLVRATTGQAIAGELWRLPLAGFGALVASVAPPLGIGSVELADGSWVKGFICEEQPTHGTRDISAFGSWRAFLASGT